MYLSIRRSRWRRCLVRAGFETALEAISDYIDDYTFVKEGIDDFNKRLNMDLALFVAQIKRIIYGKTGFEIVLGND